MFQRGWLFALCVGLTMRATCADEALQFSWKPGMSCRVRNSIQQGEAPGIKLSYDLKVKAAPADHLFVVLENPDVEMDGDFDTPDQRLLVADMLAATNLPDFEIDERGRLVGLRNFEHTRDKFRQAYALGAPDEAALERAVQTVATREMLESLVQRFWAPVVEYWAGTELKPGRQIERSQISEFPIGNAPLLMNLTIRHAGMSACQGSGDARCARLETDQRADPASLTKAASTMMRRLGASKDDQVRIESIDFRIHTETLADPATLIPVRLLVERDARIDAVENGATSRTSSVERREWQFDCR